MKELKHESCCKVCEYLAERLRKDDERYDDAVEQVHSLMADHLKLQDRIAKLETENCELQILHDELDASNDLLLAENSKMKLGMLKHSASEPQLSPEAAAIMELWPRFEDGTPVMFGDLVSAGVVNEICIGEDSSCGLYTDEGEHIFIKPGARVKRPKPAEPQQPAEPADSWERLEKDAKKPHACGYWSDDVDVLCKECGHTGEPHCGMPSDIVRRAKALAGVSDER